MSTPIDTSASVPPPGASVAPPAVARGRSAATAVALTLLFPGLGHWYAGERTRAVVAAGTTVAATLLGLAVPAAILLAGAACVWALFDARQAVSRSSRRRAG
jgi:hypothetical protein